MAVEVDQNAGAAVKAARLARNVSQLGGSVIDQLFARVQQNPDVVSFAAGAPDPAVLPVDAIARFAVSVLSEGGRSGLQYGKTQGSLLLREAVAPMLHVRGITAPADRLHVATGGSGALHTIAMALLDDPGVVLVEHPTYGPAMDVFRSFGARVVEVESDDEGMLPDGLQAALGHSDVRFIYVLPTFRNPTGSTVSLLRRKQLCDVVLANDALLVEDDVYSDLRYTGEQIPAMWKFAPDNCCYITSLSKTIAPALRIGVAVLPSYILAAVNTLKQGLDMQTSSLTQAIATAFLLDAAWPAHLRSLVEHYHRKLDLLDASLTTYLTGAAQWRRPDGGMFVWLTLPPEADSGSLLDRALDLGVAFLPGDSFFVNPEDGRQHFRLSFAAPPIERIQLGVQRLAAAISSY
ncbi:MAG: GntR family transcriptional regulator [Frankiales bacterium]|nr:GntR family transcriptional regulator [Frankiales bacterium]